MNRDRLSFLYRKHLSKSLTADEEVEWACLLEEPNLQEALRELIDADWNGDGKVILLDKGRAEHIYQSILNQSQKKVQRRRLWSYAAAASIIFCLGIAYYFYQPENLPNNATILNADVNPGKSGAKLTLSDGREIILSETSIGGLAQQGGIKISKTKGGKLIYEIKDQGNNDGVIRYNTLSTSRGQEYEVTLPDGTKIWLNASSSLKYPVPFAGKNRHVELRGEGYFEVAKDKMHPFIVATTQQEVEVLGTHFNINSYDDEPHTTTTLTEGLVGIKATGTNERVLLKPGQESTLNEKKFTINDVDTEEALSWKEGYFLFNNESMVSAMRKLSRWYDIDVVYTQKVDGIFFLGTFPRTNSLSQTLKILEKAGSFKFKIEGRRLEVMP